MKKPGVYEASMNTTLRELIYDYAGGMIDNRPLKAIIPGGSSVPLLLPEQLDIPASFDHIQKAGSLLGSAGLIVMNDSVCMVWLAMNLLHFYRHESCGKCTPCREGCDWLFKLLVRLEAGEGQQKDLDLLFGVSNNIVGKTLCAFGDAAATPVLSTMKLFRQDKSGHVHAKGGARCPPSGGQNSRSSLELTWKRSHGPEVSRPARHHRPDLLHADQRIGIARLRRAEGHGIHAAAIRSIPCGPARVAAAAGRHPEAADEGGATAEGRRSLAVHAGARSLP